MDVSEYSFFNTFQNLTGQKNRFDLWSENVVEVFPY